MLIDNLVSLTIQSIFIIKMAEYSCAVCLFVHLINQSLTENVYIVSVFLFVCLFLQIML